MRLLLVSFLSFFLLCWPSQAEALFTVEDRVSELALVSARLKILFRKAGLPQEPVRAVLVFYKDANRIDFYAGRRGAMKFVKSYPVLAASGTPGPKLREGDLQVPEGVYRVTELNPNSRFYLSMRLDYPNAHDLSRGREDGRRKLGGDIYIHGNSVSIGCLAIGDENIKELFAFAAGSDLPQWKVILAPTDFRRNRALLRRVPSSLPAWTKALYLDIESELQALPH